MQLTSELIQKYFNVELKDIKLSSSSMEITIPIPLAYWSHNDDVAYLTIDLHKPKDSEYLYLDIEIENMECLHLFSTFYEENEEDGIKFTDYEEALAFAHQRIKTFADKFNNLLK